MKKSILLRQIVRRNLFTGILLATLTGSTMSINPALANPDFSSSATLRSEHESSEKFLIADITIKGVVTDIDGEPLPGVTVSIPGTSVGTVTDIDGSYSMSVPENATLVFSFIGFEKQSIAVGSRTILNVTLKENISALEEVVVIGYGTQERKDISTAISSASAEDLKDRPSSNFVQSLQGKMPGVRISNNNSAPGGGSNIVIRGVSSINASNSPLIVIDGFPIKDGYNKTENPLNSINPADIESIEVLKDASSSAIYGTQAANGVILVTTKRGNQESPAFQSMQHQGFNPCLIK